MPTERVQIVVTESGARRVRGQIQGIGSGATAAQGAVQLLRRALAALGGALVLRSAIQTLANFSQEMSTVRAVTSATSTQFEQLSRTARDLGATTRFTATQAAEGMTFLARAGFDASEVLESVDDTLLLAQAGALDLGRAADIASNVLQGFNLQAAETARVVDVLALTANSSNTNVEQLGQAMSFAAPAAASLGISVEETAAAVGVLSNAGVQATRAGTSLRASFIRLLSPTDAGRQVLQDMGLSLSDIDVQARGLAPVLETLAQANVSLSEAAELVGVRQASNLLILTRGTASLRTLTEANREAEGTARRVADTMDDNLNGALLRVRSAFEAVILSVGAAGATGGLRGALEEVARGLRALAEDGDVVLRSLTALATFITTVFVARALRAAITGVQVLTATLLANPLVLFGTAVAGATALLVGFGDQLTIASGSTITFNDVFISAFEQISQTAAQFRDFIGGVFDDIAQAGFGIAEPINISFEDAVRFAARASDAINGVWVGAFAAIVATFEDLPRALGDLFFQALNGAVRIVTDAINQIIRGINFLFDAAGLDRAIESVGFGGVDNPFAGSAQDTGERAAEAFLFGFNQVTVASDFIDRVFEGAQTRANTRERALGRSAAEGLATSEFALSQSLLAGAGPGAAATPGAVAPSRPGTEAREFQQILDQLQEETGLLRFSREERELRSRLLEFEGQLARDLTVAERDLAESIIREQIALEQTNQLREDIVGPLREQTQLLALSTEERRRQSAVLQAQRQIGRDLTEAEREELVAITDLNEALQRQNRLLDRIQGPQRNFEQGLETAQQLLDAGRISLEEFNQEASRLRLGVLEQSNDPLSGLEAGIIRAREEFGDLNSLVANGFRDAVGGAEDALVGFLRTGRIEADKLLTSIAEDLLRLTIRQSITGPLLGIAGTAASIPGFQHGGSLTIGGVGGVDRNLLSINGQPAARVSRGETVSVSPAGARPVTVVVNTPNAQSFTSPTSQSQVQAAITRAVQRSTRKGVV